MHFCTQFIYIVEIHFLSSAYTDPNPAETAGFFLYVVRAADSRLNRRQLPVMISVSSLKQEVSL
jgi:hypothetical protein